MDFSAFDDVPADPWNATGATPVWLRSHEAVMSAAVPRYDPERDMYSWVRGRGEWDGLDPPNGVIPPELYDDIVFIGRYADRYVTERGAWAALQGAAWRYAQGKRPKPKKR